MQLLLALQTTTLYFCSSLELPQKRSKRSRALSTTSTVAGFTMFRGATELGGELMSGKLGSSKQRSVDPGTGRSYCGFSWVVALERGEGFCFKFSSFTLAGLGFAVEMEKYFWFVLQWINYCFAIYIPAPKALVELIEDALVATIELEVPTVSKLWFHYVVEQCSPRRLREHFAWQ